MHVEGPRIYQMNCQIDSFQNTCDMLYAKIHRLAKKIDFVQKKTSKSAILVDTNLGYLAQTDAKRLTPGQI